MTWEVPATSSSQDPLPWVCAVLVLLHAWVLFSPALQVILWPDSIAYLTPAADALERGYFSHVGSRGFVYPGVLWALLSVTPEPWAIVVAQRIMALAATIGLAVVMTVVARRVEAAALIPRYVPSAAATFWLAVYVLYPPTAGLAHAVGPETLATLLFAAAVGGAVLVPFSTGSPRSTAVVTACAAMASVALALVRPHWQLGALTLPLALPFAAPADRRRLVAGVTVAATAATALVLFVPELSLQRRYDAYLSRVFAPRVLFCSSGDVVYDYLSAHRTDPFSTQVAASLGAILSPEARAQARDWTLLGFNSDDCIYGATAQMIAAHFGHDAAAEARYYLTTYVASVTAHPLYVPLRLARNAAALARRPFVAATTDYWVRLDDRVLASAADNRPLFREWRDRHRSLFSGTIDLPTRLWLQGARIFFAAAGLLLTGLTMLAMAWMPLSRGRSWRPLSAAFLLALLAVASTNVLIAIVHTFEPRYVVMQAPVLVLLGLLAGLVVSQWHRRAVP